MSSVEKFMEFLKKEWVLTDKDEKLLDNINATLSDVVKEDIINGTIKGILFDSIPDRKSYYFNYIWVMKEEDAKDCYKEYHTAYDIRNTLPMFYWEFSSENVFQVMFRAVISVERYLNNVLPYDYPEWLIEHCEKILILMNFKPCKAIRELAIQNLNDITSKVIAFGGVITWHKEKLVPAGSESEWMKEAFDSLWNEYLQIKRQMIKP